MFLDPRDPRRIVESAIKHGDQVGPYVTKLEGLCRQLATELALMQGNATATPPGSFHIELPLGDAMLLVEYDFREAEAANMDVESPVCGPGHPAEVDLLLVFLNGMWTDPRDILAERVLDWMEQEILERH